MNLFEQIRRATILWLAHRLPDCKTVTMTFGQTPEHDISLRERILTLVQRLVCAACNRYFVQIKFVNQAVRLQERWLLEDAGIITSGLSDDARRRIRKAVSDRIDER
jgi:hypothetical protein